METREQEIQQRHRHMSAILDERSLRLWLGTEAEAFGFGGIAAVSRATGASRTTIQQGLKDLHAPADVRQAGRVRLPGAGRKPTEVTQPGLLAALERLVSPGTRGDPMGPLRWTSKSTATLSRELKAQGFSASPPVVARLLTEELGYTLQAPAKTREGREHPDRDAQFEHINARVTEMQARDQPVISVDTKKKELVGDYKNGGREWQPMGQPVPVRVHDFPDPAMPKAVPYGVYDVGENKGFVNVGTDHDTPAFAVQSIRLWWRQMGDKRYPTATDLLITADCGGSNSARSTAWKQELQRLADEISRTIHVCHFPPGTSKWNKIEHRLFSAIAMNWRGQPLRTYETVVNLIAHTTNRKGLKVKAKLDTRKYPKGQVPTKSERAALQIARDEFHGEWNYTIKPTAKSS